MELELNNLQRLICHKTQTSNKYSFLILEELAFRCDYIGLSEFRTQSVLLLWEWHETITPLAMGWIVPPFSFYKNGFNSVSVSLFNGISNLRELFYANTILFRKTEVELRGSLNKFPDFFRMGTFIDNTHMKPLVPSEVISSGCNALVCNRSNNFWKAPWKSSCVSVSMTFVTASFVSSIVS